MYSPLCKGLCKVEDQRFSPTVPSLDDLAADPSKATGLPSDTLAELLDRVSVLHSRLQAALTAQLLADRVLSRQGADHLLKVGEAAPRLGMTEEYLYDHADDYPFTVRRGRQVRFSEHGIERWIKTQTRPH